MADDNTPSDTPEDKAAAAAGAGASDLSESTSGDGPNPPAAPPKNKEEAAPEPTEDEKKQAEEEAAAKAKADAEAAAEDTPSDDLEDKPLDTDVWGSTGDEVGDSVLELIQNAGLSVEDAKALMFDAVKDGDLSQINEADLEAKVGKAKASLIMAGTRDFVSRSMAKAETITKEVHTAVGGEDNWNAVTTWAKTNVPADELTEYRDMIDAGGIKARFAATDLAKRYNSDDANTTLSAGKSEIVPDNKAPVSKQVLTRGQYHAAMKDAYERGATEAEINQIKADRARGRAQGI